MLLGYKRTVLHLGIFQKQSQTLHERDGEHGLRSAARPPPCRPFFIADPDGGASVQLLLAMLTAQHLMRQALVSREGRVLSETERSRIVRESERNARELDTLASKIVSSVVEKKSRCEVATYTRS